MVITRAILLISIAALASAFPRAEDEIVPETDLIQAQAAAEIQTLRQAGKTEDECRTLVTDTIKEISSAVQTQQQMIDSLDTGVECANLGQGEIKRLSDEKTEADAAQQTAHDQLSQASTAMVPLGPRSLDLLESDEKCAWLDQDQALISAKATRDDAKTAYDDATTNLDAKTLELQAAQDEAARQKKACECQVLTAHEEVWTAASESTLASSNSDAWTQAHNMQCVLEHKATCPVEDCPTVRDIQLAVTDTTLVDCTEAPTNAPTKTPTGTPTGTPTRQPTIPPPPPPYIPPPPPPRSSGRPDRN